MADAIRAGVPATAAMTAVYYIARRIDRRAPPPPETLLASAADRVALLPARLHLGIVPGWLLLHVAYGTLIGPLGFVLGRPLLPKDPVAAGIAFGEIDWVVDYLLLWPLLGLYPWPQKDKLPRAAANFIGHAVYGAALGKAAHLTK